jgi:hypothetical protein
VAEPDRIVAIMTVLGADPDVAALVQGRVYRNRIPDFQIGKMPRNLLIVRPNGGGGGYGGGYMQLSDQRVEVLAFGHSEESTYAIYLAVHALLSQLTRRTVGDCVLHCCNKVGGPISLFDPGLMLPEPPRLDVAISARGADPTTYWPYTLSAWQVVASEIPVPVPA